MKYFDKYFHFLKTNHLLNFIAEARDMKFRLLPPSPPKIDPAKNLDAASSDFNQWLHAMKMVARLPGGMPPEFRRKVIKFIKSFGIFLYILKKIYFTALVSSS